MSLHSISVSDGSSDGRSEHSLQSAYSTPPSSPTLPKSPRRPPPIIGADPSDLVGKVLTRVRKSANHPTLTLEFAHHATYQIRVDGYNPSPDYQGIPKMLEMNLASNSIFNPPSGDLITDLTIRDCAMVNLSDRAFDASQEWDHIHQGIVFKFVERKSWHCIWAAMVENDSATGSCIFRSYADVYLESFQRSRRRSPRKSRPLKKSPSAGTWS